MLSFTQNICVLINIFPEMDTSDMLVLGYPVKIFYQIYYNRYQFRFFLLKIQLKQKQESTDLIAG